MKILGINDGHLATAALLVDGKLVACVSEEKFTKVKNQSGFPVQSINYCLKQSGLKFNQLDLVVFAGEVAPPVPQSSTKAKASGSFSIVYTALRKVVWNVFDWLQTFLPLKDTKEALYSLLYLSLKNKSQNSRLGILNSHFKIAAEKVVFLDHHLAHAYAGLFASGFPQHQKDVLVLTCDGEGDKLSATVGVYKDGRYKRISATSMFNSLGNFYYSATVHLGMKPMEHEYKVMGLAPYASEYDYKPIYQKLAPLYQIDKESLQIKTKFDSHLFINYFRKHFQRVRFDHFGAAIQLVTEETLTNWLKAAIKKTGISTVALSGGVFMNVKANQKLLQLPEVKEMFVMPSCGDESNAIGAAYWAAYEKFGETPQKLTSMSLGPKFTDDQVEASLKKDKRISYRKYSNITEIAARLLADGEVVAVFDGSVEFGARALGNRSLMARADSEDVVDRINKMIKIRDFWMPFAPVILEERAVDYFIPSPKFEPYFMMATFDSTAQAQTEIKGGMHRWDKTLRVQLINPKINKFYYSILKHFEKKTGLGGMINTSFNLHGDPIVCTPEDAVRTLMNSGLKYLIIENFLVTKK